METSDSECFESADEEFTSDNESNNSKVIAALPPEPVRLEKLSIAEDKELNITKDNSVSNKKEPLNSELNTKQLHNGPSTGNSHVKVSSVKQKKVVNKPDRKSKPSRVTLGSKLGTKVKLSPSFSEPDEKESVQTKSNFETQSSKQVDTTNIDTEYQASFKKESNTPLPDKSKNKEEIKNTTSNLCDPEENMWNDDEDWEPAPDPIINHSHKKEDDQFATDWSGWGNWGVTSLLSTATMGVTTIKNHVSQSLNTVLESGMGVPQPEELARLHREEKQSPESSSIENKESNAGTSDSTFGLGSFVSSVSQITKLVETTGNKVISSGLDTLETIGKKTMEVLQEGDPGLKKKRAFLKIESNKTDLSRILREAKEKAEHENKLLEEKHYSRKANYETLFDDHQGLVHLEALEMLSKQCDIKLQTLLESQTGNELTEMQETLNQIKELCELPDDEDETILRKDEIEEQLDTAASEMNIPISYKKLVSSWVEAEQWLEKLNLNICNEMELYEQSINIMAQLTAIAVELFHKTGELLLIKEHRSTVDEADSLVQLTNTMTILISNAARQITDKLNEKASQSTNKEKVNELITNVYYEASNSSSYVKNAFQLLIPVLQVGAV